MEVPNSIVIFIPLIDLHKFEYFYKKKFISPSHLNIDPERYFKIYEKMTILNIEPIDRGNKVLKKYFYRTNLPNKVNISLDIYHIQSKNIELAQQDNLYLLRLEIYSSRTEINYHNIINYYYHNKAKFLNFIVALIREKNSEHDDLAEIINSNFNDVPLIHFNILYYKCKDKRKIERLQEKYSVNKEIIKDPLFRISADLQGMTILYINRKKTLRSGINLKIMTFRCFLLRFFTWICQNRSNLYLNLRKDFFHYYNYLINSSRNRDLYSKIKDLRNYSFAFGFDLVIFDTLNQSKFLETNTCEWRLNELEKFLRKRNPQSFSQIKFSFIIDSSFKHSKALNILDKNSWNLIYISKEKRPDYDSLAMSLVDQLCAIYSKNWNQIYVISADSDLVRAFLNKFSLRKGNPLIFISWKEESHLRTHSSLIYLDNPDFSFKLYYERI